MTYSAIGILAIIIQFIINIDIFLDRSANKMPEKRAYLHFLYCLFVYDFTDVAWGILYEARDITATFVDTELYFVAMALTILMWVRYVLQYLRDEGVFSKALRTVGWISFWFQILSMAVNLFHPVVFSFDETGEYLPFPLRYVVLGVQLIMFLMSSFYTYYVMRRSEGSVRRRHFTIFLFGLVMALAVSLQLSLPLLPLYALGCLMGVCLLHTFVLEDEKRENLRALEESQGREEQQKQELGEARRLVYVDSLTGVKNKHAHVEAEENMDHRIRTGEVSEFAVVVFDVNDLKKVNDTRGHEEGDLMLQAACKMICDTFAHSPVYRIGGDEFVAILEGRDYEKREKLMESFEYQCEENLRAGRVVVAAGLAEYRPGSGTLYGDVQHKADDAMYRRKYFLKGETAKGFMGRGNMSQYLVDHIDEAIEKGWIKVYYQPIVRSLTGELCDVEVLARWDDPKLGFLAPDQFISTLEEHGLIHRLDCYVIEKLCQDMSTSIRAGLPVVPASINFSRLDFVMCDILGFVEETLEKYEIPRELIHIEVTESMVVEDMSLMRRVIESFRNKGYEVWMDDFGSGYSSLHLLKDIQFDLVKLDMEFLSSMSERSKAIVRGIISMSKEIGVKTLAEGVETQEQIDFLTEIGCCRLQGFYYGRPKPREEYYKNISDQVLSAEDRQWREFLDVAGRQARYTSVPLEIVEVTEGEPWEFKTLFMNKAYMEQIFQDAPDLAEVDRRIYHTASPLLAKYKSFVEHIRRTGKEETVYYTAGEKYLCVTGKIIAEKDNHLLMEASLVNLETRDFMSKTVGVENELREINHLFDAVARFSPEKDNLEMLLGNMRYMTADSEIVDFSRSMAVFAEKAVHPNDQERFLAFTDLNTIRQRLEAASQIGYIEELFRVRREEGFRYREISIMMIPDTGGREYLICMKKLPAEADAALQADTEEK